MKWTPWLIFLGTVLLCGHSGVQARGQEPLLPQSGKPAPLTAFARVSPDGTVTLKLMEIEKKKVKKLFLRPVYQEQVHPASQIRYRTMRFALEESEVEADNLVVKKMILFPLGEFFARNEASLAYGAAAIGNVSIYNLPEEIVKAAKDSRFPFTITDAKGQSVTREKVIKMLSKEVPVLVSSEPVEELHLRTVKDSTLVFVLPNVALDQPKANPYPASPDVSKIIPIPQPRNP